MNQNQLYPFERNRYYAGKMLTSADFQAEQDYFNNKERFLNTLLYGSGVVCGLGVYALDDLSILMESGVAIDAQGREIVVDSSAVRKLSTIEGFEELETENAVLCIKFCEQPVHSVYAATAGDSEKNHEFSRMAESYTMFLMDEDRMESEFKADSEFLTGQAIYQDSDYRVELVIPSSVCRGKAVKAIVRTTKLSDADARLVVHAVLQTPGLMFEGNQEVEINLEDIKLNQGETIENSFWLTVRKNAGSDTTLLLKSGANYAYINDEARKTVSDFSVKLNFTDVAPRDLVSRGIGNLSLEMRNMVDKPEYVVLAKIKLIHTVNSYVIENVIEQGVKHYIVAPSQDALRSEYMDYFMPRTDVKSGSRGKTPKYAAPEQTISAPTPEIATGLLEIPLGSNPRRGDIFYSGEIMHGLGKGNVYVQIGYESVSTDESLGANARSTVYGDAALFSKTFVKVPDVNYAIKVLNDKGSFVVAAELNENLDFLLLTYRWVAIRFPNGNDIGAIEDYAGKSIVPETPTVVMNTRESHFFGVRYQNMDPCSITYSLTEENSGEITSDGIYTAPTKEGVYEICIYCTDMPVICAYAYAIVKNQESSRNMAGNAATSMGIRVAGITEDKEE